MSRWSTVQAQPKEPQSCYKTFPPGTWVASLFSRVIPVSLPFLLANISGNKHYHLSTSSFLLAKVKGAYR